MIRSPAGFSGETRNKRYTDYYQAGYGPAVINPIDFTSPLSLFATGAQGAWYDPSDFSTMFQDDAGTTPVTAVNQSVGLILDKSKNLTRGSELVTNGNFDTNLTGWTIGSSITVTWSNGEAVINTNGSIDNNTIYWFSQTVYDADNTKRYQVSFDATWVSGAASLQVGSGFNIRRTIAPNGGVKTTYTFTTARGTLSTEANKNRLVFGGAPGSVWRIDNVSVTEIAGNHAAQSSSTLRPQLKIDGNGCYSLKFDGTDDFLLTGTINPGGVNTAQIFAGVQKLSDAAEGVIVELSTSASANSGTVNLFAPGTLSVAKDSAYLFTSGGTTPSYAGPAAASYPAPITNIVTGLGDISVPSNVVRVNGANVASSASSQGTGSFLSYPLYIGRRGGTTLPFNGNLYGLIVRFATFITPTQVASTESWLNNKTKAY